jgi:hypothetical protein
MPCQRGSSCPDTFWHPVPKPFASGVVSGSASGSSIPPGGRSSGPPLIAVLGRWMMSRLAGFYIATATESAAAHTHGSSSALRQVAAAVHRVISGLSRASRTAADWTTVSARPSRHGSHQHVRSGKDTPGAANVGMSAYGGDGCLCELAKPIVPLKLGCWGSQGKRL